MNSMLIYLASAILMTAGSALMFTVTIDTLAANVYSYSFLLPVGSRLAFNAGYTIASIKTAMKGGSPKDVQSAMLSQKPIASWWHSGRACDLWPDLPEQCVCKPQSFVERSWVYRYRAS